MSPRLLLCAMVFGALVLRPTVRRQRRQPGDPPNRPTRWSPRLPGARGGLVHARRGRTRRRPALRRPRDGDPPRRHECRCRSSRPARPRNPERHDLRAAALDVRPGRRLSRGAPDAAVRSGELCRRSLAFLSSRPHPPARPPGPRFPLAARARRGTAGSDGRVDRYRLGSGARSWARGTTPGDSFAGRWGVRRLRHSRAAATDPIWCRASARGWDRRIRSRSPARGPRGRRGGIRARARVIPRASASRPAGARCRSTTGTGSSWPRDSRSASAAAAKARRRRGDGALRRTRRRSRPRHGTLVRPVTARCRARATGRRLAASADAVIATATEAMGRPYEYGGTGERRRRVRLLRPDPVRLRPATASRCRGRARNRRGRAGRSRQGRRRSCRATCSRSPTAADR